MNREIKIGCCMEQAISHILASVFTSVPKAYGKTHLPTYLSYRDIHQNGHDMRNIILKAISLQSHKNQDIIILDQEYDFSIFDKKQYYTKIDFLNKDVRTLF